MFPYKHRSRSFVQLHSTSYCKELTITMKNLTSKFGIHIFVITVLGISVLAALPSTRIFEASSSARPIINSNEGMGRVRQTVPIGAKITIAAAGRGQPYLRFQDGRRLSVDYQGNASWAIQSGEARARALATADLDGNATPDLVVGYAAGGVGFVTVQHGNPDAFAPKDDSVFVRMQQGYNPDALLPNAQTYQVPEPVDFIQAGDFNHDNRKDVLVATRGGDLFLLAGDGQGGLGVPQQIYLPGRVTTLASGEF